MNKINMYKDVPEQFHAQLCDTLDHLETRRTVRFPAKKYAVLAIAAALACSALTVGAAALFRWHQAASDKFHSDRELEDKLTMQGAALPEDAAVSSQGLSFQAIQVVNTDTCYYFLIQVTVPENISWNDDILIGETIALSESGQEFPGAVSNFTGEIDENRNIMLELKLRKEANASYGKEATVRFERLIQYDYRSAEEETLIDDSWELVLALPQDADKVSALLFNWDGQTIRFPLDGSTDAATDSGHTTAPDTAGLPEDVSFPELRLLYVHYGYALLTDDTSIWLWDSQCGGFRLLLSLPECGYDQNAGGEYSVMYPNGKTLMVHPTKDSGTVIFHDIAFGSTWENSAEALWPPTNEALYQECLKDTVSLLPEADSRYSKNAAFFRGSWYCLYSETESVKDMELRILP